jgi:signal transduction histidine kinase
VTGAARLLCATALLLAGTGTAAADGGQLGRVAFRGYDSDDGLAALDVVVGAQDGDGYIWAGSPNGLFRYDGTRFRRFSTEDGLPSTLLTALAVAPDGVLWGATTRGVAYRKGDRFVTIGADVLPVDGMHQVAFDRDGRTWVTSTEGPFVLVAPDRFERPATWPGGDAFGIYLDTDGSMLVGRGSRLLRRRPGGDVFEDVGADFGDTVATILRDRGGRLWLRAGQQLWVQPSAGAAWEERSLLGATILWMNAQMTLSVTGTVLVPTSMGLLELDGDDARFIATDLPDDARSIRSVWLDREGSLWLTSLGLHRELGRGRWRTISTTDGLPSNNIWSVRVLADRRVAVGTERGLVILGGAEVEQVTELPVMGAVEAGSALWVAAGNRMFRYDLATRVLAELGAANNAPRAVTTIVPDGAGWLWFGTEADGLYRIGAGATPADRFEQVPLPDAEVAMVWGIAVDDDRMWVTTGHGLFLREAGAWTRRFTRADGLRDDATTFVIARRDRQVCTSYLVPVGLTCYRYANGRLELVRHLDEASGLTSPITYSMFEDGGGRLWVGGARGVAIVSDDGVEQFTKTSGLPGDDCNANATWIGPEGEVWIGTSSGLGVFATAGYTAATPPVVRFDDVHFGRSGVAEAATATGGARVLSHREARFDLHLSVLSFLDERQLQVQTRLAGYDDEWRDVETFGVRHERLPAGSYELSARARYRGGAWGDVTRAAFVVEPPWWSTWWFRLACIGAGAVLLALVVAAAVRLRSRALTRRNAELQTLVGERTRELVAANQKVAEAEKLSALGRLLAQLSHEINNPLNVIHNNIGPLGEYARTLVGALAEYEALVADPDERAAFAAVRERLELDYVTEDSAAAFAIVEEAIERIAAIHTELKTFMRGEPPPRELVDLEGSVRSTVAMFARALPKVELVCELGLLPRVRVHLGQIQQTLTNLLQNASDAMGKAGRIELRGRVVGDRVELRISDDGPGIPPAVRARIFEPFFTTKEVGQGLGLGLSICREIMVAHGGYLDLDDSVARGACFVLTLPIPSENALPVTPPPAYPAPTPIAVVK